MFALAVKAPSQRSCDVSMGLESGWAKSESETGRAGREEGRGGGEGKSAYADGITLVHTCWCCGETNRYRWSVRKKTVTLHPKTARWMQCRESKKSTHWGFSTNLEPPSWLAREMSSPPSLLPLRDWPPPVHRMDEMHIIWWQSRWVGIVAGGGGWWGFKCKPTRREG